MTEQANDDTAQSGREDLRSDFPKIRAATPEPSFGPFVEAMRELQDLTVSVDAPEEVLADALNRVQQLNELLEPYRAKEGTSTAGRVPKLPGRGSLLMLPWTIDTFDADGVSSHGEFRRYHLGGNGAVHGGVLPLLFDDLFGMIVYAAKRPISRTAYLHINYRKVTPIGAPLRVAGSIDRVEGRKTFVTARLTDAEDNLLADCEALMVALLPGQP